LLFSYALLLTKLCLWSKAVILSFNVELGYAQYMFCMSIFPKRKTIACHVMVAKPAIAEIKPTLQYP